MLDRMRTIALVAALISPTVMNGCTFSPSEGNVRVLERTSDEHSTAELVRRLYEALASGDRAAYYEMLADDVVFHVGGNSIVAGEYRGKDAIAELGRKVRTETNGSHRFELISVMANASYAVTLHRWSAERRGARIEMKNLNVWRFEKGRVAERWEFIEDQRRHDEFWRP